MKKYLIKLILFLVLVISSYPNVLAEYERNIDDDFKIYELEQKIGKIIEKSKNEELLKSKLIIRVEKLLLKDEKELNSIHNFKDYKLKSFKEYALIKIYRYLSYGDLIMYFDSKVKILENNDFRVLVTLPNIKIDDNSVYYIGNSGNKIKYIESFKMNEGEEVEDFINTKILEEKYIGKCQSFVRLDNYISFTTNTTYSIGAYGDYKSTIHRDLGPNGDVRDNRDNRDIADCGYYGTSYSISYFEKRGDYLIYVNAGQDYNGVDFSLIELK
ncbi:MAG: hypothetical protein QM490_05625 [Candidatus Gracilibacteria bacterium]